MIVLVAGDVRRSAKGLIPVTLDYIAGLCEKAKRTREACLIAFLYLSGRRINEVLHLKKSDLIFESEYLTFETVILKRKEKPKERIAIDTLSVSGKLLFPYIEKHLETLETNSYLFPSRKGGHITRQSAHRLLRGIDRGVWCHWFRHMRFTHFVQHNNDPFALREFAKWRTLEHAINYVHGINVRKNLREI